MQVANWKLSIGDNYKPQNMCLIVRHDNYYHKNVSYIIIE